MIWKESGLPGRGGREKKNKHGKRNKKNKEKEENESMRLKEYPWRKRSNPGKQICGASAPTAERPVEAGVCVRPADSYRSGDGERPFF